MDGGGGSGDRRRVLIIDDDEQVARSIALLLEDDYDVVVESSGGGALRLLGDQRFDLVLCDLTMPVVSGRRIYERLRERDPEQAGRLILMTGGAFSAAGRQFLASCPQPCLAKPFTEAELQTAVAQLPEKR